MLQTVLKGTPSGDRDPGLPMHCKDPDGFSWWLLTHLAQIGMHNRNGTAQQEVDQHKLLSHDELLFVLIMNIILVSLLLFQKQLEDNWNFVMGLLKSSCDPKVIKIILHIQMYFVFIWLICLFVLSVNK